MKKSREKSLLVEYLDSSYGINEEVFEYKKNHAILFHCIFSNPLYNVYFCKSNKQPDRYYLSYIRKKDIFCNLKILSPVKTFSLTIEDKVVKRYMINKNDINEFVYNSLFVVFECLIAGKCYTNYDRFQVYYISLPIFDDIIKTLPFKVISMFEQFMEEAIIFLEKEFYTYCELNEIYTLERHNETVSFLATNLELRFKGFELFQFTQIDLMESNIKL